MAAPLLERDPFLCSLDERLCQAAEGRGQIALVSGEAGIGKTSLVEFFLEQRQPTTRTLWGACEALFTPRPLGPLYDIAQQARTPLRALLDSGASRATLFAAVLDELSEGSAPTIVVIEDMHWADEATLDLTTFLARRLHRTRALLILTYREDELTKDHPLRRVLGDLPARDVARLHLPPLSEVAVAALAQRTNRSVTQLHAVTGGNPFFLSEVLASDEPGVPTSVSDAVLAQVARRSPEARSLLELMAVVPSKVACWAVEAVDTSYGLALEECLGAGLLHLEDAAVGYRHELARQAVESALAPARRRSLHAEMLRALLSRDVEQTPLALLVHHAAQAEDGALVLRFAPAAAKQASTQGAHREAAAHYRMALRFAPRLVADEQMELHAELLDGLSYEYSLIGEADEAITVGEAALAFWRDLGQTERVGRKLRQLSRVYWNQGQTVLANDYTSEAIALLETLEPSRELAMAYATLAGQYMVVSNTAQTKIWGARAIELAERLDDPETICMALNSIGSATLCTGDEEGQAALDRSLALATKHGFEEQVARAYVNLADCKLKRRLYAEAEEHLRRGMAYCADHDMDSWSQSLRCTLARLRLDLGDWVGAEEHATALLRLPGLTLCDHILSLQILGMLRARRGDPGAEAILDELMPLAILSGEMQNISPARAARAELQWLWGRTDLCREEALPGYQHALELNRPWHWGEVAIWLWRGGGLEEAPAETPAPFALEIAGDWRGAAVEWERIGCPYEQALALMNGDECAQRDALAIFERLGAAAAAEIVRRRLRAAGVRGLPRGPRPATRSNPLGLTPRQFEILLLLAEGLQNTEIADRLSTTPKTVEHHVSAVLAKLDARSRTEAVRIAEHLGFVPQTIAVSTAI